MVEPLEVQVEDLLHAPHLLEVALVVQDPVVDLDLVVEEEAIAVEEAVEAEELDVKKSTSLIRCAFFFN